MTTIETLMNSHRFGHALFTKNASTLSEKPLLPRGFVFFRTLPETTASGKGKSLFHQGFHRIALTRVPTRRRIRHLPFSPGRIPGMRDASLAQSHTRTDFAREASCLADIPFLLRYRPKAARKTEDREKTHSGATCITPDGSLRCCTDRRP